MRLLRFAVVMVVLMELMMSSRAFADEPTKGAPQPRVTVKPAELEALFKGKESSPDELKAMADKLEKSYEGAPPEAVRMLIAIARGSQMGPGEGWFGGSQSRYSWSWMAKKHEIEPTGSITEDKFKGPAKLFARLDRNKDGQVTADDLDWSDRHPVVQQFYMINRLFRKFDREGDGRVTREDLLAFFERAAQGKDAMSSDDFRDAMIGGLPGFLPGDAPTTEVLLKGLVRSEIGSLQEGPRVEETAPDFQLTSQDGTRTVRLSEQLGSKPIILVFGNFTCGPFRSMYPVVDDLYQRYRDDAIFLAVYVREAHPDDGWLMESNTRVGVKVSQPQTQAERVSVARQCYAKLRYTMPLLVDEIDDPVGNAYSGMPARMYLIDPAGKVVYKGGRGPFGFKSGELEQALLMLLLDLQK